MDKPLRVVLIDDNAELLECVALLTRQSLPRADIHTFTDGHAAWLDMHVTPPGLLITDINRPGPSVEIMLEQIPCPIIIITGMNVQKSHFPTAAALLIKPFTPEDFDASLRLAVKRCTRR